MTPLHAVKWALGTIMGFWSLVLLVGTFLPGARGILVFFACEAAALLGGLALIVRVHGPRGRGEEGPAPASILAFLGLRGAHAAFYPLAILGGIAIHMPVEAIFAWIERRWPSPPSELAKVFHASGLITQITIGLILVVIGPLVEELFFRGALLKPLRRHSSLAVTLAVTSITFAVSHYAPQTYVPIAIVGLGLGVARVASGSLLPPVVMHGAFNALSLHAMATQPLPAAEAITAEAPPLWLTIAGTAVTAGILAGFWALGERWGARRREEGEEAELR